MERRNIWEYHVLDKCALSVCPFSNCTCRFCPYSVSYRIHWVLNNSFLVRNSFFAPYTFKQYL